MAFLIEIFSFNWFSQHRQALKSRIWVPNFLCLKAVTAITFGLYEALKIYGQLTNYITNKYNN